MADGRSIVAVNTVTKTTATAEVTCNSGADRACGYSIGVGGTLNADRTALESKSASSVTLTAGDFGKQETYLAMSVFTQEKADVYTLKIENNTLIGNYNGAGKEKVKVEFEFRLPFVSKAKNPLTNLDSETFKL